MECYQMKRGNLNMEYTNLHTANKLNTFGVAIASYPKPDHKGRQL